MVLSLESNFDRGHITANAKTNQALATIALRTSTLGHRYLRFFSIDKVDRFYEGVTTVPMELEMPKTKMQVILKLYLLCSTIEASRLMPNM